MQLHLLYFAWVRERIGCEAEVLETPAAVTTVAALLDWLAGRSSGHAAALADRSAIRIAINQDMATADQRLADDDEVAIFPPVTGG